MTSITQFPRTPGLAALERVEPEDVLCRLDKMPEIEAAITKLAKFKANDVLTWGTKEELDAEAAHLKGLMAILPRAPDLAAFIEAVMEALSRCTPGTVEGPVDDILDFLLVTWPNATLQDGEAFLHLLRHDIADERVPDAVLKQALRNIRRSKPYFPAISEVLSEARLVQSRWRCTLRLAERVQVQRAHIEAAMTKVTASLRLRRKHGDGPRDIPASTMTKLRDMQQTAVTHGYRDDPDLRRVEAQALLNRLASAAPSMEGQADAS